MKYLLNLFLVTALAASIVACGKVKETVEKNVDEKINQEIQKQTEEINKTLEDADSTLKSAGEEIDKEAKIKEALAEEEILNDKRGQWVKSAEASSSFAPEDDKDSPFSSARLVGKPDVEDYGDNGFAWASATGDKGIEWLKLTFPKSVKATEIRIRQTFNPGAIIKVELIDDAGNEHTVWEGVDKTQYKPETIQYFKVSFDKTSYKTKTVKITLATNSVKGYNEIDAVQLVGD